jgi:RNA polymerase sigma-70 factor (ECF subfamily)
MLLTMDKAANITADVWHALSDDLRAFIHSRVRHASDADDLLQEVFVRVLEKIGSLREAERIESWVYQIARNVIADFYRRQTPRPTEAVEEVAEQADNDSNTNQNQAVATWLSLLIESLPKTQRDAVRMYEIDSLSQSEIAHRLGISLSGAKSRVQRGRGQLEELLRQCCQIEFDRRGNVIGCESVGVDCCQQASCGCDCDKS